MLLKTNKQTNTQAKKPHTDKLKKEGPENQPDCNTKDFKLLLKLEKEAKDRQEPLQIKAWLM